MNEPHADIDEAVLAFQKAAPTLKLGKDATGQVGSQPYKYLSLDKLMSEAMPLLNENGLTWMTFPTAIGEKPALSYRLSHTDSNQHIEETMLLMLDRSNSQGQGSAITYARRQAFCCALGLVPDDDDDGAAATGDERLMVSRKLDADEQANMREAIAEAGLEVEDVLATIDAASIEDVTVAQGHQAKGIVKLKGKTGGVEDGQ